MDHEAYRHALDQTLHAEELAFPPEEYRQRRARVLAAMESVGVDALLVTDPGDVYYLTGYNTFEVSVHVALVFSPQGTVLQVPSIETGPAVVTAWVDEVIGYRWEGVGTVVEPLCDALAPFNTIGIDLWSPTVRPGLWNELQQRLGTGRFQPAGDVIDGVRLIKTASELDCLEVSARITAAGIQAALDVLGPGITDNAVAAAGAEAMLNAGSEFMSIQPIVTAGQRSSVIHMNHQRYVIEEGDPVFLEFGAAYLRYTAPMMKTAVVGTPSRAMMDVADLCRRLFETLTREMQPGQSFAEAAKAAVALLDEHRDRLFFSGVYGYAVGAGFPPSWVEGTGYIALDQDRCFEPGMVFHLPLCLRWPGHWGIGLSDTVVVTDNGARPITDNNGRLAFIRGEG
ncbi:M24 family metallopeptidase [Saccharospirillum salsuginis]|uniref:Xaa-Pro aminopeptidase n=1 Tax=Saccharospirillum salsuginis TaxID=418750 RepID=A0A918N5T7_9GAMM|nr:Xaa-Pro peptidase family protein [Saccharospirillum salsuginis]GGX40157.1 Xaa-Pro aminopeptidase [Saccharospirillum salsuginis]